MSQMQQVRGVATTVTTQQISHGEVTVVTYHQTDVVCFNNKMIILDTGGWETNTTKTRMNQASNQFGLGYQVYQKDGNWFVNFKGNILAFEGDKLELYR